MNPADRAKAIALVTPLVEKFEGLSLEPYLCPALVPTIGFGTTYYENGTKVTLQDKPITRERATELLTYTLGGFCGSVMLICPGIKSPELLAACTSLAYNIGTPSFRSSTVARLINANELDGVPAAFRMWNRAGGKILQGLIRRREAEIALFHK